MHHTWATKKGVWGYDVHAHWAATRKTKLRAFGSRFWLKYMLFGMSTEILGPNCARRKMPSSRPGLTDRDRSEGPKMDQLRKPAMYTIDLWDSMTPDWAIHVVFDPVRGLGRSVEVRTPLQRQ